MKKIVIGLLFAAIMILGIVSPAFAVDAKYQIDTHPLWSGTDPYNLQINGISGTQQWGTHGTYPWLNDNDTNPANNYIQAPNNGYTYFCNGFDNTASWSHVGSYPYLNNDISNYVYTSTDQLGCGYFSFPACSPTYLWVEAKSDQHASFTLLCNSFSGEEKQWAVFGTQPYLRYAGDGSYIGTPMSSWQLRNESRFGFDYLNLGTYPTGLDNATLIFTAKVSGFTGAFEMYGGDNGARTYLGDVYVDSLDYATFTLDVSSYFAGLTGSDLYNAINGFSIVFSYAGYGPQYPEGDSILQLTQTVIFVDTAKLNVSLNFQTDSVDVKYGGSHIGTMNLLNFYGWWGFPVSSVSPLYLTSSMGAYGGTIYVRRAYLSGYPTSPTNYVMGDFSFEQMDWSCNAINSVKLYIETKNYFTFGSDSFEVRDGNDNYLGTITIPDGYSWYSKSIDLTSVLTTPALVNGFKMRLIYSGDRANAKCPMVTYAYLYVNYDKAQAYMEISANGYTNNGVIRWSGSGHAWTSIYLVKYNADGSRYLAELGLVTSYDGSGNPTGTQLYLTLERPGYKTTDFHSAQTGTIYNFTIWRDSYWTSHWHFRVTFPDGSTWDNAKDYLATWTPSGGGNTLESEMQTYSHNGQLTFAGWSNEKYVSAVDGHWYPLYSNTCWNNLNGNVLNATCYEHPTANPPWLYFADYKLNKNYNILPFLSLF
jgi:hypothetical protein